jgi:hypothetical protein
MRGGRVTERVLVVSDVAARLGVIVLLVVVVQKMLDPETGSDGFPDAFLVPLGAYAAWNLAVIVWTLRRTAHESGDGELRRVARLIGVGAGVRALWLLPVASDPYWRSPAMFALLAATLIAIATATMVAASPDPAGTTNAS